MEVFVAKGESIGFLGGVGVVEMEAFLDGGEGVEFAAIQDHGVVAMGADEVGLVGDDDHGSVVAFLKKLVLAAGLEAVVAHGDDFVDEVAIELDAHGEREGEAGAHAGGISLDRLVEVAAEFGKILHIGDLVADGGVVDAANEAEVVHAGERALKSSGEGEGPGDAHAAENFPAGGPLCAADDANECGFAGTVAAEDADFFAGADAEVDIVEHGALPAVHGVALGDVSQLDHVPMRWSS